MLHILVCFLTSRTKDYFFQVEKGELLQIMSSCTLCSLIVLSFYGRCWLSLLAFEFFPLLLDRQQLCHSSSTRHCLHLSPGFSDLSAYEHINPEDSAIADFVLSVTIAHYPTAQVKTWLKVEIPVLHGWEEGKLSSVLRSVTHLN